MHARQARSKQSAKASNARRQAQGSNAREQRAKHHMFLSYPFLIHFSRLHQLRLMNGKRGPSPTILGIRIQEAQYSETLVPIYPLHAKDTAM